MGAKLREIRRRIRPVQSTMKITRAMELIATSRIMKAQQRVEAARPYAERLTAAMEDVARRRAGLATRCSRSAPTARRAGVFVRHLGPGAGRRVQRQRAPRAEELFMDRSGPRGKTPELFVVGRKGQSRTSGSGASRRGRWFG